MRRFSSIAFACAILGTTSTAYSDSLQLPAVLNILGIVTAAARPVEHALVIALNLNTLEANQTFSGTDGAFSLPLLPAAVYRIIAVKPGFAPKMTMIVPTRKDYRIALRLDSDKRAQKDTNQEIWELRGSLPPDILRELDMAMAAPVVMASNDYQIPRLKGEMISMTGVATPVQGRTVAKQNLFAGNPGSDLIEIAGNTTVMQTRRSDIGVTLRVAQESLHNTANATFRTADLTANANLEIVPSFVLRYGMSSRMGLYGAEWAPRAGAEFKLSKDTSFVVSGLCKVCDKVRGNMVSSLVMW